MQKKLTPEQVRHYKERGYLSPVDVLARDEALEYRRRLEESEKSFGPIRMDGRGTRSHLLFTWVSKLIREKVLLDAVEDLIGPDILVLSLTVWPKEAKDAAFVSWHQDSTYRRIDPPEQVTAWVALSDVSIQAGCMEVVPGSHHGGQVPHAELKSEKNLLSMGQTITGTKDFGETAFMPLQPGQVSFHHLYMIHGSGPNNGSDRRLGIAIAYIPTRTHSLDAARLTATLVRGQDEYGHFDLEPAPQSDYDENARAFHAHALKRWTAQKTQGPVTPPSTV